MNKINNSKKSPEIRFPGFTDDWVQRKFKDILKIHSSKNYLAEPSIDGKYMIIQQGDNPIAGYADGNPMEDIYDFTLFGDHTVSLFKPTSPFFVATDGIKILSVDGFDGNYLFNTLQRYKPESQGYKRHFTILKNEDVWYTKNNKEQHKIGSFFKQLDETITLHQRKLDLLKEQKKGFLQKMFPKNGEKVPEIRFPGFPDDWEHRKLGDMLDLLKDGSHGTHKDVTEGIYLLSAKNIKNSQIVIDESTDRKISEDEYNSIHKNFSLQKDDVLLTIVGSIGESAILRNPNNITFQRSVAYLRPNRDLQAQFLLTTINGPIFQSELKKRQVVSAQPGIYLGDLALIPIQIPSVTEQQKVGALFKQLNDTITLHQRKLELLKEIKKAFLQKMFV